MKKILVAPVMLCLGTELPKMIYLEEPEKTPDPFTSVKVADVVMYTEGSKGFSARMKPVTSDYRASEDIRRVHHTKEKPSFISKLYNSLMKATF